MNYKSFPLRYGINVSAFKICVVVFILIILIRNVVMAADGQTSKVMAGGPWGSVVLTSDGTPLAWGYDEYGETGDWLAPMIAAGVSSFSNPYPEPMSLSVRGGIVGVACGGIDTGYISHTLLLRNDGMVLASGAGSWNQLGNGAVPRQLTPTVVNNISGIIAVAAGAGHSMALRGDGNLWTWGYNSNGQLGFGLAGGSSGSAQVTNLSQIVSIAAGSYHSVALKADGTVWDWGYNNDGQLGNGLLVDKRAPVMVAGLTNVIAIAAGGNHSMALASDGTVWTWGDNAHGEAGIGTTSSAQSTPVQVTNLTGIIGIAAGGSHCLALKKNGTVWAWGANQYGQIGNGTSASSQTQPVEVVNIGQVASIAAGEYHSMAMLTDGLVYEWGYGFYGQIGDLAPMQTAGNINTKPIKVDLSASALYAVSELTSGGVTTVYINATPTNALSTTAVDLSVAHQTTLLKSDGTVWSAGYNGSGGLGNGTGFNYAQPVPATGISGVTEISVGGDHTLALTSDGSVWAWGANYVGQLGNGICSPGGSLATPTQVLQYSLIPGIISWWPAENDSLDCISTNFGTDVGVPYTQGEFGQAFNNSYEGPGTDNTGNGIQINDSPAFQLTNALSILAWINPNTNCSTIFWRGDNLQTTPYSISMQNNSNILFSISSTNFHVASVGGGVMIPYNQWTHIAATWAWLGSSGTMSLYTNGNLASQTNTTIRPLGPLPASRGPGISIGNVNYLPGTPFYGGIDEVSIYSNALTQAQIQNCFSNNQSVLLSGIRQISAGGQHSLALDTNGFVWAWGGNVCGQLGRGNCFFSRMASITANLPVINYISAGGEHSLAVDTNGAVWGWGCNAYGQLGIGNYTNQTVPILITNFSQISMVSAGDEHSLALSSNGQVYAWGDNANGQIGNGATTNCSIPVLVQGLPPIASIGAGTQFSVALATNGTVWAWGYNSYGQLGNGSTTNCLTPVEVPALVAVIAIQVFNDHVAATLTDGSVRVWGANQYGQLGISSDANQFLPAAIPGFYINQPSFTTGSLNVLATNATRYIRGGGNDFTYKSFVIPLDSENGVKLDDMGTNGELFGGSQPWFTEVASDTRHQIGLISAVVTNSDGSQVSNYGWTNDFQNPIVAFGSSAGGSSLSINQPYRFGIYAGAQYENTNSDGAVFRAPIRILVYRKSDFQTNQAGGVSPFATNYITVPRRTIVGDQSAWMQYLNNGLTITLTTNGLTTMVQLVEEAPSLSLTNSATQLSTNTIVATNMASASTWNELTSTNQSGVFSSGTTIESLMMNLAPTVGAWGVAHSFVNARSGPFILTHTATSPDYCYVVEALGVFPSGTNVSASILNTGRTNADWCRLYSLDFDNRQPWQSLFVSQPQFNGQPLPPQYLGASPLEMGGLMAVVTNVVGLTSSIYTNLDDSPELRRNPTLDQFVSNMGYDPFALANYVQNQIGLCDALSYNENSGNASAPTITQDGVNRSALGVYLEGEGSPMEQCALLVYLLRSAGYPAAYVFPTNNNVLMLDTRLSSLLRMQIHGAVDNNGNVYTTNSLIAVNYPWVVAQIGTNYVNCFPWLKDTEIVEGLDLYSYLPQNYNSGAKWLHQYIFDDPNIFSLSGESDLPSILFPEFISTALAQNYPGIGINNLGMTIINRQHYYSRWQDFPVPNVVTNQSQVVLVDCLGGTAIKNVSLQMTNVFNTIELQLYGTGYTNQYIDTGEIRLADVVNRELLAMTNGSNMQLWLAPYLTGNTNQSQFGATDPALTNIQCLTLPLTNGPNFNLTMIHRQHKAINPSAVPATNNYLGIFEQLVSSQSDRFIISASKSRTIHSNDVVAICFNVGRVSDAMVDVHMQKYWQMEQQLITNGSYQPAIQAAQGVAAYLMGMDYYRHVDRFKELNQNLHKVHLLSWFSEGLCKLTFIRTQVGRNVSSASQPTLDIFLNEMAYAGNGTTHQNLGNDALDGVNDFSMIMSGEMGAQEHNLLNGYYTATNSISAVELLRLAQQRSAQGAGGTNGIVELTQNSYVALGQTNSIGYGTNWLENFDPQFWTNIASYFGGWDASYMRVYLTPAPMSTEGGTIQKMAAVAIGKSGSAFIASQNLNDGEAEPTLAFGFGNVLPHLSSGSAGIPVNPTPQQILQSAVTGGSGGQDDDGYFGDDDDYFNEGDDDQGYYYDFGTDYNGGGSSTGVALPVPTDTTTVITATTDNFWQLVDPSEALFDPTTSINTPQTDIDYGGNTSPIQITANNSVLNNFFSGNTSQNVNLSTFTSLYGNTGGVQNDWQNVNAIWGDPVSPITGAFHIDTTDLQLAGPFPIKLRRNYSSQSLSDKNNFGYGWQINYVPYLMVITNHTGTILFAAEEDGTTFAYRQQAGNTNLYIPTLVDNPMLENNTLNGIGSTANMFKAKIVRSLSGTNVLYSLSCPDGSTRVFQVQSYPLNNGTNIITRTRPYLLSWSDNCGNSRQFFYGTNSTATDYGQLIKIQSSSGSFVGFYYNYLGYITEAYTGDGRFVQYAYDSYGDLVGVTLPDQSQTAYQYHHYLFNSGGNYYYDSDHALTSQIKPEGQALQNMYDSQRRVIVQLSTVGSDFRLYTNAIFTYNNTFAYTNSYTNLISGVTLIQDAHQEITSVSYTNSMITQILDPLNQALIQNWFFTNNNSGGYQRSIQSIVDKRGLITSYFYDSNGNATNRIISGSDLTGDGQTNAAYYYTFNATNLLVSSTDPLGNQQIITYANPSYPFRPTSVSFFASNGTTISSNVFIYTNSFTVVTNGPLAFTNSAYGLLWRSVKAAGSTDAATNDTYFDGRGMVISRVGYSGTSDPNITNFFDYDSQGNLIQQTDIAGRNVQYGYDEAGRVISKKVFDLANPASPVSAEFYYYNQNGQLTWYDGPRSNPDDYVWYDYDGAGRKIQEINWRSNAKPDGSGATAATGNNLYATKFYQYDLVGNLTAAIDQYGNTERMNYDSLGRLLLRRFIATNSITPLKVESFGYEPGGQIASATNALGGIIYKYYTTTGKLKQQVNPDGSTNFWTYYLDGRLNRQYLVNGNYYQMVYNDANRTQLRTFSGDSFYSEAAAYDRRGNVVLATNSVGAVFTAAYDDLNRLKQITGPAATSSTAQQVITETYDAIGRQVTSADAYGDTSVNTYDALQRVVTNAVYDANQKLIHITTAVYSPDFNSVTSTVGTGTNAISTTVYADTFGKPLLTQQFPAPGITNYTLNTYDIRENLVASQDQLGQTTTFAYDPMNRLASQTLPDGSITAFGYNAEGGLTNRVMPGGLTWSATYDAANRLTAEKLAGNSQSDRHFTYQYYQTGPNIGHLQTTTDVGRNVTETMVYDAYLRVASNSTSGSLPDQNLSLVFQYDERGLATNLIQYGLSSSNSVRRTYDAYGQPTEETISINGTVQSDFTQSWDNDGRRTLLSQTGAGSGGSIAYSYQPDGLMTNVLQGGQNYGFNYANNDLLLSRQNPWRNMSITQRDGEGRPLQQSDTVGGSSALVENLTWQPNSTLASYSATRSGTGAWNDNRNFLYNARDQLTNEPIGVTSSVAATNSYAFDANKLGVLTQAQWSGGLTNGWQATSLNSLGQVTSENWNGAGTALWANGVAGTASSVSVLLDGQASYNGTLNSGSWYAYLTAGAGSHSLMANGYYPVGQYYNTVTNNFTVAGTNGVIDYYDGAGNITNRVFASGKTQTLIWDGFGRLVALNQRDSSSNGFNWTAVYDGLGRRLRTVNLPVLTNTVNSAVAQTNDSFYDPLVEFEEVAVAVNGQRVWKVLGPDLNGSYGGMQGVGGIEATIVENGGQVTPVLNDYWGNVPATIGGGQANWSAIRVSGYGPVGAQAPVLSASTSLAQTLIWRSREMDPGGFYYMGARYYDPVAGHFISPDPLGHTGSADLYSAFNGDPINNFDADGRGVDAQNINLSSQNTGLINDQMGAAYVNGASANAGSSGGPQISFSPMPAQGAPDNSQQTASAAQNFFTVPLPSINPSPDDGSVGNGVPNYNFGTIPGMTSHTETTLYMKDGSVINPTDNVLYNRDDIASYSQNIVTEPTDQTYFYISDKPLPPNGKRTVTPVDFKAQEDATFAKVIVLGALTVITDGEAAEEGTSVLFGQRRIGPAFSTGEGVPSYLSGRPISDVAADLRSGVLSADQLPINAFTGANGELITINNRTLGALSEAGLQPTRINMVTPTRNELLRLTETPIINSPIPGPSIPVTPSMANPTVLRLITIP